MTETQAVIRRGQETIWTQQPGDMYVVTGVDRYGRRFPAIRTGSWSYARGINLWRGTVWLERNGKRYKLSSTIN